jgi:hypothetical protein
MWRDLRTGVRVPSPPPTKKHEQEPTSIEGVGFFLFCASRDSQNRYLFVLDSVWLWTHSLALPYGACSLFTKPFQVTYVSTEAVDNVCML